MMVLLRTQRFGMEEKTYRCNIKEITLKKIHTPIILNLNWKYLRELDIIYEIHIKQQLN